MNASEWDLGHSGVSCVAGAARRLAIWDGYWLELNGLSSESCVMLFPIERICDPGTDESCFAAHRAVGDCISAVVEPNPALVSARPQRADGDSVFIVRLNPLASMLRSLQGCPLAPVAADMPA